MPAIETSLHASYQEDAWDLAQALREIISNAIDGEARNKDDGVGAMTIEYSKRAKVLRVINDGISVPAKALLMGASESRSKAECIGTFGEGLPMALLVLARKGMDVIIYNGSEKWTPVIEKIERFGGEPVLVIKTRQLTKSREAFIVELHDIDPEEYADICGMFLRLDGAYDEKKTIKEEWGEQRVLLEDRYKGRIYNKGVFVLERDDLLFGYDLDTELNRDRAMIDEWDLRRKLSSLLVDCVSADKDQFLPVLERAVFSSSTALEVASTYGGLKYSEDVRTALVKSFRKTYGENSIPVEDAEEVVEAALVGKKGVIVSPLLREIVREEVGTLSKAKDEAQRAATAVHILRDLEVRERRNLGDVMALVQTAVPSWTPNIRIVDFGDPRKAGLYDDTAARIDLARHTLDNFDSALLALVRQVTLAQGAVGYNAQLDLMATVVRNLILQQSQEN